MPAVDPKVLKRLKIKDLLAPFAMSRGLSSAQLSDLVARATEDKRFDLSASSDEFADYHLDEAREPGPRNWSNPERLATSSALHWRLLMARRRSAGSPKQNSHRCHLSSAWMQRLKRKRAGTQSRGEALAALYNCERADRGGRTKTLIALALALGLSLRIPDLPMLSAGQGLKEAKLAEISGLAFGTVRSTLTRPDGGNVKTLEKVAHALGEPVVLVV